jgi:hypothetical protein
MEVVGNGDESEIDRGITQCSRKESGPDAQASGGGEESRRNTKKERRGEEGRCDSPGQEGHNLVDEAELLGEKTRDSLRSTPRLDSTEYRVRRTGYSVLCTLELGHALNSLPDANLLSFPHV